MGCSRQKRNRSFLTSRMRASTLTLASVGPLAWSSVLMRSVACLATGGAGVKLFGSWVVVVYTPRLYPMSVCVLIPADVGGSIVRESIR